MTVDQKYLEEAGFLFERERGVHDDYIEFRLNDTPVTESSVEQVLAVISSYITKKIQSSNELLPAAIFALGQSHDARFATLYLEIMKTAQLTNISASLQAVLAYEKLGIQVIADKASIVEEEDLTDAINTFLRENNV